MKAAQPSFNPGLIKIVEFTKSKEERDKRDHFFDTLTVEGALHAGIIVFNERVWLVMITRRGIRMTPPLDDPEARLDPEPLFEPNHLRFGYMPIFALAILDADLGPPQPGLSEVYCLPVIKQRAYYALEPRDKSETCKIKGLILKRDPEVPHRYRRVGVFWHARPSEFDRKFCCYEGYSDWFVRGSEIEIV